MPSKKQSFQERLIEYVMTAPPNEVRASLETASAVLKNRIKTLPAQMAGISGQIGAEQAQSQQAQSRKKPGPAPGFKRQGPRGPRVVESGETPAQAAQSMEEPYPAPTGLAQFNDVEVESTEPADSNEIGFGEALSVIVPV
jgi:hypothetical protein